MSVSGSCFHKGELKSFPFFSSFLPAPKKKTEKNGTQVDLPGADLDVDVETFARMACGLLDIPVYNNIIESLHVLFTLFSEFRANQHFQSENL